MIFFLFKNDDEAERQALRLRASLADSDAQSSTISDNEGLKNCLKIFNENVTIFLIKINHN